MHRQRTTDRLKLVLILSTAAVFLALGLSGVRSSARRGGDPPGGAVAQQTPAPAEAAAPAAAAAAPAQVEGCVNCHTNIEPMHETRDGKLKDGYKDNLNISCTDCHGGNPFVRRAESVPYRSAEYEKLMDTAHVQPRFRDEWRKNGKYSSANPERTNALLVRESQEFVRFINPGDFRVASLTCASAGCHAKEVDNNLNSMMRHGAMLWGAALYNNGGFPVKDARFGESYTEETGAPERIIQLPPPLPWQRREWGVLSVLDPLPRWEISQPANTLRVFERGGKRRLEVGLPDKDEDPGKPDKGLSARGFGTLQRTDPVYLGIQKTRLLDPTLNFLGTNDHPGDFRSSGCTGCHVVYANDTSVTHSSPVWAKHGKLGTSDSEDRAMRDGGEAKMTEPGHPIKHQFTNQIPSSQCMSCHMHPGTNMVLTYFGMMWWDNETDARAGGMYPEKQKIPSEDEKAEIWDRNPEGSAVRGNWGDRDFLLKIGTNEHNSKLERTQFADFHGHGWIYRAVFKKDRKGNMLDANDAPVTDVSAAKMRESVEFLDPSNDSTTTPKDGAPVHLKDIHLEKGMHCVDCHFRQDAHGNGILYGEPRAAIEIQCVDCHGSIQKRAGEDLAKKTFGALRTSGFAAGQAETQVGNKWEITQDKEKSFTLTAPVRGATKTKNLLTSYVNPNGVKVNIPVFQRVTEDGKLPAPRQAVAAPGLKKDDLIQNSLVELGRWWRVVQTKDTVTEGHRDYNWQSAYSKTIRMSTRGEEIWSQGKADDQALKEEFEPFLAHADSKMTCFACHSSWMTSCFGCHLSMTANRKMVNRHNEGGTSRNFTTYNYQVLRDDVFMLGRDGTVTGHKIAPVASRSAVIVSSQNQNREWIYSQQQTISAEGYAGQAFSTHVPHTVRSKETKSCDDCHVSEQNDNNAWMAQTLLQGTNFVNFMGRYVYIAGEEALEVVPVTEHNEPQAVIGSTLHEQAYPDDFKKFVKGGRKLSTFFEHVGNPEVLQVQLRGEYAYVAAGKGGLRIYDVAQIDHKGFSERITTAPISRFGQKFWVKTKDAVAIAAPSTLAVDPARARLTSDGNFVGPFDRKGNVTPEWVKWVGEYEKWQKMTPEERRGKQAPFVNEEQLIHLMFAFIYVADREEGLVLVNAATLLDGDPLNNYLKRAVTFNPDGVLTGANNITVAGTFVYVTTDKGLVIVDIDNPLEPKVVKTIGEPHLKKPNSIAVQFRYGFVTDEEGLKVINLTLTPGAGGKSQPRGEMVEGAEVDLHHTHSVYVARTYAYVACGEDGIAIVDVEHPEKPKLYMKYNADGAISDAHDVKVAMTNASLFAYVADGKNGLRILQLTSPETDATFAGFSPAPKPRLISTFKTLGPAISLSKGLDRDRAVDETGNQIAVFGRRGARPFTLPEMQKLYLYGGRLRTVLSKDQLREMEKNKTPPPAKRNPFRKATPAASESGDEEAATEAPQPSPLRSLGDKFAVGGAGGVGMFAFFVGWRWRRRLRSGG